MGEVPNVVGNFSRLQKMFYQALTDPFSQRVLRERLIRYRRRALRVTMITSNGGARAPVAA